MRSHKQLKALRMAKVTSVMLATDCANLGIEFVIENLLREYLDNLWNTWKLTGYSTIVFGTVSETGRVPTGILSCFKHEVAFDVSTSSLSSRWNSNHSFYLKAPDESERYEILDVLSSECALAPDVSLSTLATQTAAFVASDLVDLVARAQLLSVDRVLTSSQVCLFDQLAKLIVAVQVVQLPSSDTFGYYVECC